MFKKSAAAGVICLSILLAATSFAAASTPQQATPNQTKQPVTETKQVQAKHGGFGGLKQEAARIIGIDEQLLVQELKAGKTLAEIAQSKGMDSSTLKQKLQASMQEKIDKAVADGKITKEKADKIKGHTSDKVSALVDKKFDFQARQKSGENLKTGKGKVLFPGVFEQISSTLGMNPQTIKAELKNGKSLAQLAEEKGIKKTDLAAKIQTAMEANLSKAVAEQKISAEKAAEVKKALPQKIEKFLNCQHNQKAK